MRIIERFEFDGEETEVRVSAVSEHGCSPHVEVNIGIKKLLLKSEDVTTLISMLEAVRKRVDKRWA